MNLTELQAHSHEELVALVRKAGGQRAFSRKYAIPRTTLQNQLYRARQNPFGHRPAPEPIHLGEPGHDQVQRWIVTSAQDATQLHEEFLDNLEAYREFLSREGPCEIMIAGFTYNKALFEEHAKHKVYWPARIEQYLVHDRIRLCDKVDFCGEMNTLPTAVQPLSGFETYTRDRWGIFPHAKLQLVSVATMKHEPAKLVMTTGAVTLPNYVPKKAGIKASFHHVFGAVLVEVAPDGSFFCRHLIGDEADGSFYDLDRYVCEGHVSTGHAIRSLTPGDVHVAQVDPEVCATTFGIYPTDEADGDDGRVWAQRPGSMVDELTPDYLFIHDVSDFRARNHHNIADPHDRFRLHIQGVESVEDELREVAFFLSSIGAEGTEVVVVESNHDEALLKWLRTADYRSDPINARFFLQCQLAAYQAMEAGDHSYSVFRDVMCSGFEPFDCDGVRFLRVDDSFLVDGVENANHGHNGANGARGNIRQFAKAGPKMTVGHAHTAGIFDGVFQTGTTSKMDLGYNRGMSSWTHTHAVQYRNGKRALITIQNGKYRA